MSSSFLDRSTTLCLACSSSLPPLKNTAYPSSGNSIHITNCCHRPICPSCISSNPRLARYNPCLACLGGVDVVSTSKDRIFLSDKKGKTPVSPYFDSNSNLDGSLRDQDTFVLGDDEDDEDTQGEYNHDSRDNAVPPPPYTSVFDLSDNCAGSSHGSPNVLQSPSHTSSNPKPIAVNNSELDNESSGGSTRTTLYKYYLNRKDTLQGIALRFGLDGYEICRMNNLPSSVLRTMPHLLHTRSFLLLPPSAKPHPSLTLSTAEESAVEAKLVRERAEKKFQTLTKEADWRIAKTYVALADDAQAQADFSLKQKEMGLGQSKEYGQAATTSKAGGLDALAIEQYLDDEEWEAEERRAGRGIQILRFPLANIDQAQETKGDWWNRRKV